MAREIDHVAESFEESRIARTPLEVERVYAILMHEIGNTPTRISGRGESGAIDLIEWLQGNDDALASFGITEEQWSR